MAVYVVQAHLYNDEGRVCVKGPSEQDLSDAERYGKLISLLPPGQVTYSIGPTVRRLNQVLSRFTDEDYLLLIGDPIAIGLAVAIAAKWNRGNLSMLKWDRLSKKYTEMRTNLYTGEQE